MTLSGLGGVQEFGCATSRRVQTKAVTACVLGKWLSGDAAAPRPIGDWVYEGEIRLPSGRET
jgi:hypothetical protein